MSVVPGKSGISGVLRTPWYRGLKLIERRWYRNHAYPVSVPYGRRVYAPWYDPAGEFHRSWDTVHRSGHVLWEQPHGYMLYQFFKTSAAITGDVAECGVATGGSAHLLSLLIEADGKPRNLHLFDTFTGMPRETTVPERDAAEPGDFAASLAQVEARLAPFDFAVFHPGVIPNTLEEVADIDEYAFVHVNVVSYEATRVCLEWFWPRLKAGGAIMINEYGLYRFRRSTRQSVDEFFDSRDVPLIVLGTGQVVAIKHL
ncbi:MAG: TylF/MycF/NovP-related O-methyltransferase [Chloroflexota bacterium]